MPTRESLIGLGQKIIDSVPDGEKDKFGTPLIEGFNNLCLSLISIEEALSSHYFVDKFVTAVGKTEWADIKWNDQSIVILLQQELVVDALEREDISLDPRRALWRSVHGERRGQRMNM